MEIRKLTKDDLSFLISVRNASVDYLHDKRKFTLEQCEKWFNTLKDPYFIIIHNGEYIGYARTSNWENSSCYIGMDIAPVHRGKGYAVPAYNLLMKELKTNYNIKELYLEVLSNNHRAKHIYDKLGFIVIDTLDYDNLNNIQSIKMVKNG
jgi:RimJ/RimL family protein N-acetyltransferase